MKLTRATGRLTELQDRVQRNRDTEFCSGFKFLVQALLFSENIACLTFLCAISFLMNGAEFNLLPSVSEGFSRYFLLRKGRQVPHVVHVMFVLHSE